MASMVKQYGSDKGKRVFYATARKNGAAPPTPPPRRKKRARRKRRNYTS
jgi:hypothetical protein